MKIWWYWLKMNNYKVFEDWPMEVVESYNYITRKRKPKSLLVDAYCLKSWDQHFRLLYQYFLNTTRVDSLGLWHGNNTYKKFQLAISAMQRAILGISFRDRIRYTEIHRGTGVTSMENSTTCQLFSRTDTIIFEIIWNDTIAF